MTPRSLIEPARLAGTALLHTQSDERLVDLTRAGNARAFEAIVSRYRKQLLRYCAGILPAERAEDAVQQAFMNAYKAIVADEAELNLRPWLYRIAHNSSLNLLRQNGWNYDEIPEDFDGVMQPPQAVEQSERIREVVRDVRELPERQRDAIVLRELEGRSYDEIAVALGVSDGAVRQLLNRARTTLRAAATAITPPQLVARVAEGATLDAPAATRIAEISVVGAGGAMTLAKFGTEVVVAGAVAGGMAGGPLDRAERAVAGDVAQAAEATAEGAGFDDDGSRAGPGADGRHGRGHALELAEREDDDDDGDDRRGRGGDDDRSGRRDGDDDDDRSGHGGGDDDDGDGDRSGPGGDGDGDDGDHAGSGSGDDGGDSSGSGSSGSGGEDSSGSDSSGSGSSGSDSSGSGSSGSGSGSSGSGSSGSDSSGSGSGFSGSDSSGSGSSGSGISGSGLSGSGSSGSGSSGSG